MTQPNKHCEKCYQKVTPQIDGTRYICLNASCLCHQPPQEPWEKDAWEKVFNKLAFVGDRGKKYVEEVVFPFIRSLLSSQRTEDAKKWVEILNGMVFSGDKEDEAFFSGYNRAITDAKTNAKEKGLLPNEELEG